MEEIIVVMGAAGHQGAAVARHLLSAGWKVRAITRHPQKSEADVLRSMGAEVFSAKEEGDVLDRALDGAYGFFSVQQPWEQGADREMQRGRALAGAALRAGVRHFIYSSAVTMPEREDYLPQREEPWEIEKHLREIGLSATIFHPAFFMENFCVPALRDGIYQGVLSLPLDMDTKLQMIAMEDIGLMTAQAFANPREFIGESIEAAGDELTGPQMSTVFSHVLGRPVEFIPTPIDGLRRFTKEFATMLEWFTAVGYEADLQSLQRRFPNLRTLESWLIETGWAEAAEYEPVRAGR